MNNKTKQQQIREEVLDLNRTLPKVYISPEAIDKIMAIFAREQEGLEKRIWKSARTDGAKKAQKAAYDCLYSEFVEVGHLQNWEAGKINITLFDKKITEIVKAKDLTTQLPEEKEAHTKDSDISE